MTPQTIPRREPQGFPLLPTAKERKRQRYIQSKLDAFNRERFSPGASALVDELPTPLALMLLTHSIYRPADLTRWSARGLLSLPGIGPKRLLEIEKVLRRHNLRFKKDEA
jgi:hypothetical protein